MSHILALDLATCTGFAVGSSGVSVQAHGSFRLPKTGQDVGRYLVHFRDWLSARISEYEPWTIYFESPMLMGLKKTTPMVARKLNSLAGVTEMVATDRGIDCREANVSNICTHFLGRGYPRKRERRKAATMSKCRELGWNPNDDNSADALALLDYALSLIEPSSALRSTPLFRETRP
jgi:hypothetical protein